MAGKQFETEEVQTHAAGVATAHSSSVRLKREGKRLWDGERGRGQGRGEGREGKGERQHIASHV